MWIIGTKQTFFRTGRAAVAGHVPRQAAANGAACKGCPARAGTRGLGKVQVSGSGLQHSDKTVMSF